MKAAPVLRGYRLRFLQNALSALHIPRKEKLEEFAPTAIAPPVVSRAMVPGSGVVPLVTQLLIVLVSNVTAPLSAMALPQSIVASWFKVMLWSATMFPMNAVVVPSVAELPTCQ